MINHDNWGWRARIGMFIVSSECVPEAEWWAMMPPGASVHAARVDAPAPWATWRDGGDGGARRTSVARTVGDSSIGILAAVDVVLRAFDHVLRYGNPRIPAATQTLNLRDRRGPLIEIVSIGRADIAPSSRFRLRPSAELNRLRQNFGQFIPPIDILFLAENLR